MPFTKEQCEAVGITYREGITDEEIVKAIKESNEAHAKAVAEKDAELAKNKTIISDRNSEIAKLKDEQKAKLPEEEKTRLHIEELEKQLADEKNARTVSERKAKYVEKGYSPELAEKIANAELKGEDTTELHGEFIKAHDEKLKAELLKQSPAPEGGGEKGASGELTHENFVKGLCDPAKLNELKKTNPAEYQKVIHG